MEEYFDFRWRMLREFLKQPRGSECDELEGVAEHVTAHDRDGRLIGVGRLHLNDPLEAQIRFMATAEHWRGRGVGRAIVEQLELLARQHEARRIVLNAREAVVGFYERLGYRSIGKGPTMFDALRHVQMLKEL